MNDIPDDIYRYMENPHPIHILNQLGVITSFSVAKKISEEDIYKIFSLYKRTGKSDTEIDQIIKEKILGEIEEAITNQKIPGLLSPEELTEELGISKSIITNMSEMNRFLMVISNKLLEKKYDRMSLCYFINSLVNCLGLSESDFEKFHRQNSPEESGDGDGSDEDDGDSGFEDA